MAVEKPYPPRLQPGEIARVVMARSAAAFLPDIEAFLVEQQLTTRLAPTVAGLMDVTGWSLPYAVSQLRAALRAEGETDGH